MFCVHPNRRFPPRAKPNSPRQHPKSFSELHQKKTNSFYYTSSRLIMKLCQRHCSISYSPNAASDAAEKEAIAAKIAFLFCLWRKLLPCFPRAHRFPRFSARLPTETSSCSVLSIISNILRSCETSQNHWHFLL